MKKIKELKQELKKIVKHIREEKRLRKEEQRGNIPLHEYMAYRRSIGHPYTDLSSHFRYRHVAYCLLRGKKYDEIERKLTRASLLNHNVLEEILQQYREVEPIACAEVVNV